MAMLAAEALDHTSARPTFRESLVRFCVTGICSLGADFAILFALHSGAGVSLTLSTILGSVAAVLVNYTLNRNWTFQATASHGRTLVRYLALVGMNFGSTLLIVLGLSHLGLYYLVSKLVAVGVNAGINFLSGRFWVFKD